jgi:hypothetical protein
LAGQRISVDELPVPVDVVPGAVAERVDVVPGADREEPFEAAEAAVVAGSRGIVAVALLATPVPGAVVLVAAEPAGVVEVVALVVEVVVVPPPTALGLLLTAPPVTVAVLTPVVCWLVLTAAGCAIAGPASSPNAAPRVSTRFIDIVLTPGLWVHCHRR